MLDLDVLDLDVLDLDVYDLDVLDLDVYDLEVYDLDVHKAQGVDVKQVKTLFRITNDTRSNFLRKRRPVTCHTFDPGSSCTSLPYV